MSIDVKKYSPGMWPKNHVHMEENDEGKWVSIDDYRALAAEAERLKSKPAEVRDADADRYQRERAEDNGAIDYEMATVLFSLGIAGEAGEVADYMKKVIGHGKSLDKAKLTDELGDVLWYISQLAHIHDIKMSEIMAANTSKLRERYPCGFKGDLPHWTMRMTNDEAREQGTVDVSELNEVFSNPLKGGQHA